MVRLGPRRLGRETALVPMRWAICSHEWALPCTNGAQLQLAEPIGLWLELGGAPDLLQALTVHRSGASRAHRRRTAITFPASAEPATVQTLSLQWPRPHRLRAAVVAPSSGER